MALKTGTYTMADLLEVRFQSVAQFGEDTITDVLNRDRDTHNAIMLDLVRDFADVSSDRQRIQGTSAAGGEMVEADEFTRAPTQKDLPGQTVGFPMRRYQYAWGVTRDYTLRATPRDLALKQIQAQRAHLRRVIYQLKVALFRPTNFTFIDFLVDQVSLGVKALVNADGAGIVDGPNGEVFDGATHTHYDGVASLTTAAVDALIQDVVEHGHGSDVRIYINRTNEAAFRALTGFIAFLDPAVNVGPGSTAPTVDQPLDISRLDNRPIGRYNGATIYVKPWMLANYAWCFSAGDERKPFVFRQRDAEALQGLRVAGELDNFPLRAQYQEVEFGIGAWNRTNGAVLQFNSGTYAEPTIAL